MKIIVVLVCDILKFPPTISLLNAFGDMGIETVLVTTKTAYQSRSEHVSVDMLDVDYEQKTSAQKLLMMGRLRRELWAKINQHYTDDAIIWVVTDVTVKYLGYGLIGKRYVLQLLELSDKLTYYKRIPQIYMDARRLCDAALEVVVPEYNRAHIMRALWNIRKLPSVISNSPYPPISMERDCIVEDANAAQILRTIGRRKMILYQGIIGPERPLEPFIKAVDCLGDEYAFVIMARGADIYKNIPSRNCFFIPFIAPPYHLQVTSHAHIGILSYTPSKSTGYSVLNTLYCAPNKVFEYSCFGIPMIGNDNPGLRYLFAVAGNGEIFAEWEIESICAAVKKIEAHYEQYSRKAHTYYEKTDVYGEISSVLSKLSET